MLDKIPEYQVLLNQISAQKAELKRQKRAINSTKRKLEKLDRKYKPIYEIFSKSLDGNSFEKLIAEYFKIIGYQSVMHITEDTANTDIEIMQDGKMTCIEVKSLKGSYEGENEIFQILKYKSRRQDDLRNLQVEGILVLNHDNTQNDYQKRNKNPFDKKRERDALLNHFSLVSTVELLNGLILLKTNYITFEQFDKIIHTHGVVKFSKRHVKKVLSKA